MESKVFLVHIQSTWPEAQLPSLGHVFGDIFRESKHRVAFLIEQHPLCVEMLEAFKSIQHLKIIWTRVLPCELFSGTDSVSCDFPLIYKLMQGIAQNLQCQCLICIVASEAKEPEGYELFVQTEGFLVYKKNENLHPCNEFTGEYSEFHSALEALSTLWEAIDTASQDLLTVPFEPADLAEIPSLYTALEQNLATVKELLDKLEAQAKLLYRRESSEYLTISKCQYESEANCLRVTVKNERATEYCYVQLSSASSHTLLRTFSIIEPNTEVVVPVRLPADLDVWSEGLILHKGNHILSELSYVFPIYILRAQRTASDQVVIEFENQSPRTVEALRIVSPQSLLSVNVGLLNTFEFRSIILPEEMASQCLDVCLLSSKTPVSTFKRIRGS